MEITLCDRCKKPANEPGKRLYLWFTPYAYKFDYDTKSIVLCPKCFRDFKKFMNDKTIHSNDDFEDDEMEVE